MRKYIVVTAVLLAVFMAGVAGFRSQAAAADALINAELRAELAEGSVDFFVKMANDVDTSDAVTIQEREARLWYVYETKLAHAEATQADLLAFLDRAGYEYVSFWINNSVFIKSGDLALARELAGRADVAYLRPNTEVPLVEPVSIEMAEENSIDAVEWGVARINADDVWALGYNGTGIVVANIDTGARYTHNALSSNYRGANGNHDYDWWDPDFVYSSPVDFNGHGTHTMGTMVGDDGGSNQIGVAPGAQWIAAQGCDSSSCSSFDLTSSAQFIACPTRVNGSSPNCGLAPHVVNNSWGGGGGDPWYQSYVDSWIDAGIAPVFSAGNSGIFGCSSLGSPGDYKFTVGVGATDSSDTLASFSSRGPSSLVGRTQPDISAPGVSVRSAYYTSNSAYALLSGTSMAAPHTAGALALMLDKNENLPLLDYYRHLVNGARTFGIGNPPGADFCGGTNWNSFSPSNNIYGHGILDALASVNLVP